VFCGPSCVFTNVLNPRSHVSRKSEYRRTLVRRGSSIGANATIVCGVTLGEYAFIGAGAVVTSDVPDFGLMVGVPARRVGWMCQCGIRLEVRNGAARCGDCAAGYREEGGKLKLVDPPSK
jgi:UDP-2-acetamido-3-amino-2,3-dideoxy-glucuronate N-acetyltransferase